MKSKFKSTKVDARKQSSKSKFKNNSVTTQRKENPFEKIANAKKKHEVLNRRVKGEDRNVGRARQKVIYNNHTS